MSQDTCARATESQVTSATSMQIRSQDAYSQPRHDEQMKRSATIPADVVEDMVMKRVIPAMAKAMRLEFDQAFRALLPHMVEEVLKKLNHSPVSRLLSHHVNTSASKSLKLLFVGTLPDTLWTLSNIECQEGASLEVELQDSSGSRVEDGPEAFLRIKIFVLHGEFEVEDIDDWTNQEFDKNIVQPRKDRGPLLKGEHLIHLHEGVACVRGIAFTDNSKSVRAGTFRLGARAVKGLPSGVEVRDAVSGPFKVKERRAKFYRKLNSPSLEDATHRLKNIGHTFCVKLAANGIHTVKDFLQLYHTNANKLQDILQVTGNKWSELVKNANLCSLTDEYYQHYDEASGVELLLDCVFNIVRVTFSGKTSLPYGDLDDSQKELVNKIRLAAYKKREKLRRTDDPSTAALTQTESVAQSIIPHSNMRYLDRIGADTTALTPCSNPTVDSMLQGQDLCRVNPSQANLGGEELLPRPITPGLNDGVQLLSLMPPQPGMPINQTQNSNFQHQSLNTSPNSSSSEGTNASMNEQFRLGPAIDTHVVPQNVNGPEEPMSYFNGESKRRRLG